MTNIQFVPSAIDAGSCVSNGWNLTKPDYWMYFGITTLIVVASVVLSCIPFVPILFQIFVMPPITIGIFLVLFRAMRNEPVDFGMFFKGFDRYVPAMVIGLIHSIPSIILLVLNFALNIGSFVAQILQGASKGSRSNFFQPQNFVQSDNAAPIIAGGVIIAILIVAVVFMLFSIAWGITFFFALPILAEKNISAIDAVKLSARAGWSNVGGIIVLVIFEFLIALVGVMALCVGVLFIVPVIFAANAFAYRQVFPWIEQNFKMNPPPPSAYGDFGRGMQ